MAGDPSQPHYTGNIISDPADIRDLIYRPTLGLLPEQFLSAPVNPAKGAYNLKVRDQGEKPSCVGEALAALVDIQRLETYSRLNDPQGAQTNVLPASGPMLHAMALEIEGHHRGQPAKEIYSLRSGLKGFYNTGVCTEATWDKRALAPLGDTVDSASTAAMREARNVTLGAYYRVRSFVNDYHAALVEAGALYVSGNLHDGWKNPADGVIRANPMKFDSFRGGHAFVVVGYERRGFLVLNSWGPDWGNYAYTKDHKLPGIALWTYEDWGVNVEDAWVLRLAAPTPDAFRFAIGQHGNAMFGADQSPLASPSVRRLEVLDHYIHLDDGHHVTSGSYPGSRNSLETTIALLESPAKNPVTDIRLTLHGDIAPTADVLARIARSTSNDKGVHGFSLLWVNGLLSGSSEALNPLFEAAFAIAKGNQKDADERIEMMARPVGRALWRDAKRSAETAAATDPEGDATHALRRIVELCTQTGRRLHILTEGAGVLLMAAILRDRDGHAARDAALAEVLASVTFVAPLITAQEFNPTVGRFLDSWAGPERRRATLFRANAAFDQRLRVGTYGKSWTDLVSNAFEERSGDTSTRLIGAFDFAEALRGDPDAKALQAPLLPGGDLPTASLLQHKSVTSHVARKIADAQRKGREAARHARIKTNLKGRSSR